MIDIKVMGDTSCIYHYTFKQYLQTIANILEKRYKYQLNATIVISKLKNHNIAIQIRLYDSFLKIDSSGKNVEVVKLDPSNPNQVNYMDIVDLYDIPNTTTPIEIELAIVVNLMRLIYVIGGKGERIDTYNSYQPITQLWTLNMTNSDCIYSNDIHYLDKLRATLDAYTAPLMAKQIDQLKRSNFLCYDSESTSKMVEIVSNSAIDLILKKAEDKFNIIFDGLESFDVKVKRNGNHAAKLSLDVEINSEADTNITNIEFTTNYSDDFNNPLQIPDPSGSIAALLCNFFNWYAVSVDGCNQCAFLEQEFNFKEAIMDVLHVNLI